jgi:ATP-dependent helicase HrpB
MTRDVLPVDACLPELIRAIATRGAAVLQAPTGAGKTTRVPPALLGERITLVLEPRRVAARAAARRMSIEDCTPLGETFGYHVRFDKKVSARTRCVAVTPGILLRLLHDDLELPNVGTVIFDEFHERGIDGDLAFGLCRLLRETIRPDLNVIVMSATLDPGPIAKALGDCPIVVSEGRLHPVAIHYRPRRLDDKLEEAVARAIREALHRHDGDLLAFLPGVGEIRRVAERLESMGEIDVLSLHGELPPEEQDRALRRGSRRRVVLATNVAETSVTVDGVSVVVDAGLARVMRFEPAFGMDRLTLQPISRQNADQRAGRAGRTGPGVCYRLWSEVDQRSRAEALEPEIARVDFAGPLLQLHALGQPDVAAFPWLDAPPADRVTNAESVLQSLGFLADGRLTTDGEAAAGLPVHPRLGRLLIDGDRLGCGPRAALAAAILADRDPFRVDRPDPTESDLLDRVHVLEEFANTGRTEFGGASLHRGGARAILDAAKQLSRSLGSPGSSDDDLLLKAIFAAYADRLCRRRGPNDRRAVMRGGRGVRLGPMSGVNEAELFVAIDCDAAGPDALVRMASGVTRDWLDRAALSTNHELEFDETSDRIVARKRTRWHDLLLDDQPGHIADDAKADELIANAAIARGLGPAAESPGRHLWERLQWLIGERPDFDLPKLTVADLLPDVCRGLRSLAGVPTGPWAEAIRHRLSYQQSQLLDREAPATLEVPTGSKIALSYEPGRPPVLAVRIQELFGLAETPRIAGGKVSVLLHLLAPNYRPQQVTADLASFWANGYPIVRKELRGRYPKHIWPDDPLTAEAIRGAKRRPPE